MKLTENKKAYFQDYYQKNKEHLKRRSRERYKENPEQSNRTCDARRIKYLYNITKNDIQKMFERQKGKCLGCHTPLVDKKTGSRHYLCIDHNHKNKEVRGLLCNRCNTILGLAEESATVLRRLMAYLDRNPYKILVYITGSLKNARIPEIGNMLRELGYDAMDEWYTPGPEADDNWQAYEKLRKRSYKEALRGRAATNIFLFDRSYLDLSDVVIGVLPCGKSAMLELGYAKAQGKIVILFLDSKEPDRYDIMPNFADEIIFTEDELKEFFITKLPANLYAPKNKNPTR